MLEFKHLKIVLFSVIVFSASMLGAIAMFHSQSHEAKTEGNHFSVLWKGFSPEYSDQYPDYYICINNLKEDTLKMHIAVQIQNFENSSYWFLMKNNTAPPPCWTTTTYYIGRIGVDEAKSFVYSNLARCKPTSIPEGRMTETIDLSVEAYYDASYTKFYHSTNFSVNFHFINYTSNDWYVLYLDDFDDGTVQGWTYRGSAYAWDVTLTHYRSWPNSLHFRGRYSPAYQKEFDTTGPYRETYLLYSIWLTEDASPKIALDGVTCFQADVNVGSAGWYQFAIPLPLSLATEVWIYTTEYADAYLDSVYVIAK
jgi:hypothetical protein